jgi:small-conductance mechanosensitive channel
MHLPDGPQIDLSAQVARVKAKTRPWKSIIALVLAIAAAVISRWKRHEFTQYFGTTHVSSQLIAAVTAAAFGIFGSIATYGLSGKARSVLEPRAGASQAAVVRYALLLLGGFTTLVITLLLFDIPVGQLVLGGALTSVFVGIAAQQALGNVFAGIVLLLAHPFRVGDAIRLRAGAIGGQLDGVVTEIGITYVRLDTGGSVMSVPNSQVLNAIVGPIPQTPDGEPASDGAQGPISHTSDEKPPDMRHPPPGP